METQTKFEVRHTPVPRGIYYIVNVFDRPSEEQLAMKNSDGTFSYVHPTLRRIKRYQEMKPENPTPVEDFGITLMVTDSNELRGKVTNESVATYNDGRPRRWQGDTSFSIRL